MKRPMERAVAATTDGEVLNVQLSTADRAVSTDLFHVLVMLLRIRCPENSGRAEDTEGTTGW